VRSYQNTKLFLFDLDGTVYLGDSPIPGAIEKLKELSAKGIQVGFLTNNSSKSVDEYIKKLNKMGYPATRSQMVSSSMSAAKYILEHYSGKSVYALGTDSLKDTLSEYGIAQAEDADIALLGFDTTLTYQKLWHFARLLQKGKIYIATHHDINCPSEYGDMPDAGAMIALLEKSTGRVPEAICGKPFAPMAHLIASHFGVEAERTAMVGDRLYTDIAFGIASNMTSILVLSGESSMQMYKESGLKATAVLGSVADIEV
jgi:4-nitrophenyl phosphatase